jgi:hypothetical protein
MGRGLAKASCASATETGTKACGSKTKCVTKRVSTLLRMETSIEATSVLRT